MLDPKIIKNVKRRLAAKKAELKACKDPKKILTLKAEILALDWASKGCPLDDKIRK
ncbi:MAG: hypothetical protein H8E98_06145 [Bacteroidetes bacterium]|nr:hypothetical protein [Bacteroidota bacterium]